MAGLAQDQNGGLEGGAVELLTAFCLAVFNVLRHPSTKPAPPATVGESVPVPRQFDEAQGAKAMKTKLTTNRRMAKIRAAHEDRIKLLFLYDFMDRVRRRRMVNTTWEEYSSSPAFEADLKATSAQIEATEGVIIGTVSLAGFENVWDDLIGHGRTH
jgi:hypothetical protein